MDARDAELVAALLRCCRTPLEDVAEKLGISIAATHKRLMAMEESGLIRRHRALVNPRLVGASAWYVRAATETVPTVELIDAVGAHPAVFQVIILSHRNIGITAVFRAEEGGEREEFEPFLRQQKVIAEAFRAFELPVRQHSELTEEACRVLAGMAYDARRPLSWLARKTKLPQRRVSAVVDALIRDGAVIFTLDLSTGASSGTWAELEVEGVNVAAELSAVTQSRRHLLWLSQFAGTQTWYAWVWCESAGALQTLVESLTSRSLIVKEAGVILSTHGYPVWVHDELVHRAQASSH